MLGKRQSRFFIHSSFLSLSLSGWVISSLGEYVCRRQGARDTLRDSVPRMPGKREKSGGNESNGKRARFKNKLQKRAEREGGLRAWHLCRLSLAFSSRLSDFRLSPSPLLPRRSVAAVLALLPLPRRVTFCPFALLPPASPIRISVSPLFCRLTALSLPLFRCTCSPRCSPALSSQQRSLKENARSAGAVAPLRDLLSSRDSPVSSSSPGCRWSG